MRIFFYEYNGVIQASLESKDRLVTESDNWVVGIGCDRKEAREELQKAIISVPNAKVRGPEALFAGGSLSTVGLGVGDAD